MKKLISVVLVISILFSFNVYSFAQESSETVQSSYATHLINLGILDGFENIEFTDYPITRGEFANVIKNVLGVTFGRKTIFSDVDENTAYYEGIYTCAEYKVMNGFGDGTFRPDDVITYKEAYKILVSLLEYDTIAGYEGGYPYGYYIVAKKLGITSFLSGVSYENYISWENLPRLIYEFLLAPCNDLVAISDKTVSYAPSNESYLERHMKLSFKKGVITADEEGSIEIENNSVSEDIIRVNGESFLYSHSINDRLCGKYAEVIYDAENANKVKSIAFPEEYNREITITGEMLTVKNNTELEYLIDGVEKRVRIPSDILYILNGEPILYYDLSTVVDEALTFNDNDGDNRYDTIRIEKYDFYAVDYVYGDCMVADKSGKKLSLKSNTKDVMIFDKDDNLLSLSQIKKDMVLSVIENSKTKAVYVNDDTITGKTTYIDADDSSIIISDLTKCFVNPKFNISSLRINQAQKYYKDIFGRIFFVTEAESDIENYAYIIRGGYETVPEFSFKIRVIKTTGEITTLDVAERFYLNDTFYNRTVKRKEAIPSELFDGTDFISQLIRYTLNADGEIFRIELPSNNIEDDFFYGTTVNDMYVPNARTIGRKIVIDDDTKIIVIPETDVLNEENYFTYQKSNLNTMQAYKADSYHISRSQTADIVIIKGEYRGLNFESNTGVFLRAVDSVDSDGVYGKKLYFFVDGNEKSAFVDYTKYPNAAKLKKGDTARYSTNDGKITGFEWVYDLAGEKWKLSANPTATSYDSSARLSMGYIADFDGTIMRLSYNKDFSSVSPYSMEAYITANFSVTVVEKDGTRVLIRAGDESDIRPYDIAVIRLRSGSGRSLIIYKTK